MSRPRSGFAKRQKEMARFEKRQLKLARRQKGKEDGATDESEPQADAEASPDPDSVPIQDT